MFLRMWATSRPVDIATSSYEAVRTYSDFCCRYTHMKKAQRVVKLLSHTNNLLWVFREAPKTVEA
jgi:hypothetical protein